MRFFIFAITFIGVFLFLAFHYSFWAAVGVLYFAVMLAVSLIAFAIGIRSSENKDGPALDEQPEVADPEVRVQEPFMDPLKETN